MTRVRIGTYNVHKCRGMDWRLNTGRIAKVMRELKADILAVQEVFRDQAECLARHLGSRYVFGPVRQLEGQDYGNAVFTCSRIIDSEQFDLTVKGREPRACLRACVECDRTLVHFFAVHLGTSFFERRHQAERLVSSDVLDQSRFTGARIVAGDFNEWTRGLATRMLSRCLQSADMEAHLNRSRTYPGVLPFLHLDHIYYDNPMFHLTDMHLHRTPASLIASDHLPLLATFSVSRAS